MAVKEDRRARVQKIMGGGDNKPSPKITAENLLPTKPGGGARITSEQVQSLRIVNVKLGEVSNGLKDQLVLSKVREGIRKRREEKERRRQQEAALEAKKGKKDDKGGGLKSKAMGFFEKVFNFLLTFLIGSVIMKLVDRLGDPKFQGFLKGLTTGLKWIGLVAGKLFEGLVSFIDWAYGIYDKLEQWVGNTFGEEAVEKFKTFSENLKHLINGFIAWKLVFEKIFKSIIKNITRAFKFVKKFIRTVWVKMRRLLGRKIRMFFKNLAKRAGGILKGAGRGLLNIGKSVAGRVGGLLSRGGGKLASTGAGKVAAKVGGWAAKLFGKAASVIAPALKAAKPFASKFLKRIPIFGSLIVGIISLMSGEPLGQALFKTIGAGLGGALGTFIPIPVIGTLLGEIIGAFVGDLLYYVIIKRDPGKAFELLKGALMNLFKGGKAVVDWFGRGIQNFTDNFPTFDVPDVGLQDAYIAIADKIGLGGVIDWEIPNWIGIPDGLKGLSIRKILDSLPRIPDILGLVTQFIPGLSAYTEDGKLKKLPAIWQLYNPMYMVPALIKSFFQGGGEKSAPSKPPAQVSGGGKSDASDVSESASYEQGGEGKPTIIPIPIVRAGTASISSSSGGGGGGRKPKNVEDPMLVLYQG